MEIVSNKRNTVRRFPHLGGMAKVWPATGEETQWVMAVPALKGCAGCSRSAYNCPLHGRASADFCTLHQ